VLWTDADLLRFDPGGFDALANTSDTARKNWRLAGRRQPGLSCGNPNALALSKGGRWCWTWGRAASTSSSPAARWGPKGDHRRGHDARNAGKARQSIAAYRQRSGLENVEFRLGEIEHLPVADDSVDVVISNCVVKSVAGQAAGLREIPGAQTGEGAVSTWRCSNAPGSRGRNRSKHWWLCGGAVLVSETERMVRDAGLDDIELKASPPTLMAWWTGRTLYQKIVAELPAEPNRATTSPAGNHRRKPTPLLEPPLGNRPRPAGRNAGGL